MNLHTNLHKLSSSIIEKKEKLLNPLVDLLPKWLSPNHLAWTRLFLTIPVVLLFLYEYYITAIIIFIIAFLLDVIDGTIARRRKQITNLCKILDPLADKFLFLSVFLILCVRFLDIYTLSIIIVTESISIFQALVFLPFIPVFNRWKIRKRIGANIFGKLKSFIQVIATLSLIIAIFYTPSIIVVQILFWISAILCFLSSLVHQIWQTKDKSLLKTKI